MTQGISELSQQLLVSKLRIPALGPHIIVRTQLTEAWCQVGRHALTLIAAPAGYGKTTLIGEWHASHPNDNSPLAYLALDREDNDPVRFAAALFAALSRVNPRLVSPWRALLQARRPPPLKTLLAVLVNRLQARDTPLALVLDDYHSITSAAIHEAVARVLDLPPASLHVVISTRRDPPLPLAQLRARGQLLEIRASDLAFRHEEANALLNRAGGLHLSMRDSARLLARTEGWPAALQLVALSLRGQTAAEAHQRVMTFSGSHRHIFDYLVDQVLQPQTQVIQKFLLETSILDRFNGALCDALTGRARSGRLLDQLAQNNLLLVPLDEERQWYRYHPLWSECLRERLRKQARASTVRRLHARASLWFELNRLPGEAIQHALSAADFERAAELIDRAAEPAMARGEVETILTWLTALPDEQVRSRPGLCVWYGWTLCLTGRLHEVETRLQWAESALEARLLQEGAAARCRTKLGEIAAVRALVARLQGQWTRCIAESREALASLHEGDLIVRSAVTVNLGLAYIGAGDHETGGRALADAERTSAAAPHPYIYVRTLIHQARLCVGQGRLPEAIALYQRARERSARDGLETLTRQVGAELGDILDRSHALSDPLSPRESDVLRLMAAGRSTREIAAALVITTGTVRNHAKSIFSKLGVHSRFQAVEHARALSLL